MVSVALSGLFLMGFQLLFLGVLTSAQLGLPFLLSILTLMYGHWYF